VEINLSNKHKPINDHYSKLSLSFDWVKFEWNVNG